jgi:hypothetical protein
MTHDKPITREGTRPPPVTRVTRPCKGNGSPGGPHQEERRLRTPTLLDPARVSAGLSGLYRGQQILDLTAQSARWDGTGPPCRAHMPSPGHHRRAVRKGKGPILCDMSELPSIRPNREVADLEPAVATSELASSPDRAVTLFHVLAAIRTSS